jgi:glutamyl-tRNA synthetase
LHDLVDAYTTCDWNAATLKAVMDDLAARYDVKRNAQAAARVAVTGRAAGPPLFEVLEVMGRDESLRRLRAGLARLS